MINRRFGIELEMAGISREDAAKVVAEFFGSFVRHEFSYDCYFCLDSEGRKWKMMSDSSISSSFSGGCEFVTPLCDWNDIEKIQQIVRLLKAAGAKVNDSCGLHVHVDVADYEAQNVKNLVNMVAMREDMILKALGTQERRIRRWCQKVDVRFLQNLNSVSKLSLGKIEAAWYGGESRRNIHYDDSRYRVLNLHSLWQGKGIELRCFEATMHAGEIKAYIQFSLALCERAKTMRSARYSQVALNDSVHSFGDWLYRLGIAGDEYATCYHHMMKRLDGKSWSERKISRGQAA